MFLLCSARPSQIRPSKQKPGLFFKSIWLDIIQRSSMATRQSRREWGHAHRMWFPTHSPSHSLVIPLYSGPSHNGPRVNPVCLTTLIQMSSEFLHDSCFHAPTQWLVLIFKNILPSSSWSETWVSPLQSVWFETLKGPSSRVLWGAEVSKREEWFESDETVSSAGGQLERGGAPRYVTPVVTWNVNMLLTKHVDT